MTGALRLLGIALGTLLVGSIVSLALARDRRRCGWASFLFVTAAGVLTWVAAARALSAGSSTEVRIVELAGVGATLAISIDPLSAVFLLIATAIAVLSTLFSIHYMDHYRSDQVAKFYPVLQLFFASIIAVLLASDFLFFLVFWELMTLTSFFLVIFERESQSSQRAGLKYFIVTHAATLCMLAAALVLWDTSGSFHFAQLREALSTLIVTRPIMAHTVILLFFLGFATKAGVLPMGDWLPDAHPVAPSGVSAALSGVLVKLGIYGMMRLFCNLLPISPASETWGWVVALAGTGSLFVGTLTAVRQTDSKRLMAFSTIGQIGYICLAIGVGVHSLRSNSALAAVALAAALLHAMNHACFKSCLFLGAGSVLFRTGKRNLDQLGGLAASMPYTAGASTVASLSISGVPPFNGFASKWLIVVSCLLAGMGSPLFLVLGLIALFISLASLASFMQVLASVFYGRSDESVNVREVPPSMAVPQVILAGLCVVLGVFPQLPLRYAGFAVERLLGMPDTGTIGGGWSGAYVSSGGVLVAFWSPVAMLIAIAALGLIAYAIQRAGGAAVKRVPVWYCGEEHPARIVRYAASSLYLPFKDAFRRIYPSWSARAPRFPPRLRSAFDLDRWLYEPSVRVVLDAAGRVSRTHVGTPQVYLLWIVIGAMAVLGIMLALAI
ncbi:MAG: proton-conducting transporter membrane subunit [Acidobacteriota bacterium]